MSKRSSLNVLMMAAACVSLFACGLPTSSDGDGSLGNGTAVESEGSKDASESTGDRADADADDGSTGRGEGDSKTSGVTASSEGSASGATTSTSGLDGGLQSTTGASTSGAASADGGSDSDGMLTDSGGAETATGGDGSTSGAVPSAGCGKASTVTFGAVPGSPPHGFGEGGYVTIQSGGERGFAMRLPDNYDPNKPYPLFFGFHWNGGTSNDVDSGGTNGYNMSHYGLQKLSENGAFFVAPQGIGNGWANTNGRDLTFVDDMIELITENYCIDTTQLFANGFSYGGGMSYALACARADVFRGVAIYNGGVLSGCEGGNDPIAFWQMAGLTDGILSVGAGVPMRDRFVTNNGCTAQDPPQPPPPPPYLSDGGHICTDYAGCSDEHPLRWCVHQSGHGNAVVDGTGDLYNTCATPPQSCSDSCPCTWVPEDVWSFFNSL